MDDAVVTCTVVTLYSVMQLRPVLVDVLLCFLTHSLESSEHRRFKGFSCQSPDICRVDKACATPQH